MRTTKQAARWLFCGQISLCASCKPPNTDSAITLFVEIYQSITLTGPVLSSDYLGSEYSLIRPIGYFVFRDQKIPETPPYRTGAYTLYSGSILTSLWKLH